MEGMKKDEEGCEDGIPALYVCQQPLLAPLLGTTHADGNVGRAWQCASPLGQSPQRIVRLDRGCRVVARSQVVGAPPGIRTASSSTDWLRAVETALIPKPVTAASSTVRDACSGCIVLKLNLIAWIRGAGVRPKCLNFGFLEAGDVCARWHSCWQALWSVMH